MDSLSTLLGAVVGVLIVLLTQLLWNKFKPKQISEEVLEVEEQATSARKLPVADYVCAHSRKEQAEKALSQVLAAEEDSARWEKFKENKGITMLRSNEGEIKGWGIIKNLDAATYLDLCRCTPIRLKLDEMFKLGRAVETIDDQTLIIYQDYERVWPTTARDFCMMESARVLPPAGGGGGGEGGGFVVAWTSVEHPACVVDSDHVRGNTIYSGFVIRQQGKDLKVTFSVLVDLKGNVPKSLVAKVNESQPLLVRTLGDFYHATPKASIDRFLGRGGPPDHGTGTGGGGESRSAPRSKAAPPVGIPSNVVEELVRRGDGIVADLMREASAPHWEKMVTEDRVRLSVKVSADSPCHGFKGVGVVNAPPQMVYNALKVAGFRKKYDKMLAKISVVAQLDDDTQVIYMMHETRQCISKVQRDFCVLQTNRILTNPATSADTTTTPTTTTKPHTTTTTTSPPTYVCAGQSLDFAQIPEYRDLVRAKVLCAGFIISPHPTHKTASVVTSITQVDLGGSLPPSLINLVSRKQPLCIAKIRSVLERQYQEVRGL